MAGLLRLDGTWPGPITLTSGWFRARARPWNETHSEPMVRLDRGGAEFLVSVTNRLLDFGVDTVYSPALFSTATGVWRRAGYEEQVRLEIMERVLTKPDGREDSNVEVKTTEDLDAILSVDRAAFQGFWGMSRPGLEDAYSTNKSSVLLTVERPQPVAYALVGSQWGVAYLHRIAVHPDHSGNGLGAQLMNECLRWGYESGARTMVLNVRPDNPRAKRLYDRAGFVSTHSHLEVLRYSAR